jgi:hypothetical protein
MKKLDRRGTGDKEPTTRDEQFPGSLAFMDVEIKWSHILLLALSGD